MLIASLDLARHCGYAIGETGTVPVSGSWDLRLPTGDVYSDCGALAERLAKLVRDHGRPDLVAIEEPFEAFQVWNSGKSQSHTFKAQHMLVGAAHAWCGVSRIDVHRVNSATVRVHICGKKSAGSRADTKKMVIARMKLLGLIPKDSVDDNQADAVAIWRFAEDTIANVRASLVLA